MCNCNDNYLCHECREDFEHDAMLAFEDETPIDEPELDIDPTDYVYDDEPDYNGDSFDYGWDEYNEYYEG